MNPHKIFQKFAKIPPISNIIHYFHFVKFPGSKNYWEERYKTKGTSGAGSYNRLAIFKAEVLNQFIDENKINDVIEFGCGDGNQLSLLNCPTYIGFDVAPTAIKLCKERFAKDKNKSFFLYDSLCFVDNNNIFQADLTISLDVIYHLIEEEVFHEYMKTLFSCSKKYVIIYSINIDETQTYHEKHREFSKWIYSNRPDWKFDKIIKNKYPYNPSDPENTSISDFFIFKK